MYIYKYILFRDDFCFVYLLIGYYELFFSNDNIPKFSKCLLKQIIVCTKYTYNINREIIYTLLICISVY